MNAGNLKKNGSAMSFVCVTFRAHFKTIGVSQLVQKLKLGPHTNMQARTRPHTA